MVGCFVINSNFVKKGNSFLVKKFLALQLNFGDKMSFHFIKVSFLCTVYFIKLLFVKLYSKELEVII